MCPLVVPDTDQFRSMISFRTSTVYEMLLGLAALQNPGHRHRERAERVRAGLSQDFLDDLEFFYTRFENGIVLMELAVDYPDHDDVEGFLRFVEGMDVPRFLFYVLGRLAPAERMAELEPSTESLLSLVKFSYPEGHAKSEAMLANPEYVDLVANPEAHQARLVGLWRRYWEMQFKEESEAYRQVWEESIREKSIALSRQDAEGFVRTLSGGHGLPHQIPDGYTTEEVILVPSYFALHHVIFYGYGSTTVIYDCQITEWQREKLEALGGDIVALGKALGDKTRLELLKWIVRDTDTYGQSLAKRCHISQPSVSRHLRILREAGIIEEKPTGNRMGYEVRRERVEEFSKQLIAYLYE